MNFNVLCGYIAVAKILTFAYISKVLYFVFMNVVFYAIVL